MIDAMDQNSVVLITKKATAYEFPDELPYAEGEGGGHCGLYVWACGNSEISLSSSNSG